MQPLFCSNAKLFCGVIRLHWRTTDYGPSARAAKRDGPCRGIEHGNLAAAKVGHLEAACGWRVQILAARQNCESGEGEEAHQ
jgi:hypothetical protein